MKLKHLIRLAISLVLLGIIISQVDLGQVLDLLRKVDPWWLAIGFGFAVPGILVSTWKWQILLKVQGIVGFSFARLVSLYFLGIFFSSFLPTEVGGDAVRSYFVGRPLGKVVEALAAAFIERVTGFGAVIIYAVLGSLVNWSLANQYGLSLISFGAFAAVFVGVPLLAHPRLGTWLRARTVGQRLAWAWSKIQAFQHGLSLYGRADVLTAAMLISFVNQAISIIQVFAYGAAIGLFLDLQALLLIVPIIILIGVLPISISGLGIREGAFVVLLSAVGTSADQAFVVAMLSRVGLVLPALVGGVLYAVTPDLQEARTLRATPEAPGR